MRAAHLIAIAIVGFVSIVAPASPPLSDALIEKLVVGIWKHENSESYAVTEYHDDGTFIGTDSVDQVQGRVKIRVTGRWKVSDGDVIEIVEKCEPAGIPPGTTRYDRVLELNVRKFRYCTEQGIEKTKTRLDN